MAKHLDLEEQEQLDQIKHFWGRYGDLITWALIAVFGSFAAWNGWNYWQRHQASQASALYDEVERAAGSKDVAKIEQALGDLKKDYGKTRYADQGALLAAKALVDASKPDAARAALNWVSAESSDPAYQAIARLRLAGLDLEAKAFDQALKILEAPMPASFAPLLADRRGDIYMAQGKKDEATAQYATAMKAFGDRADYRRLVEIKLASLGVDASADKPPQPAPEAKP